MKLLKHTIIFLLATIFLTIPLFAQEEVGKIFTQKEAAMLFGSTPSVETEITVDQLLTHLAYTQNKLMFTFYEGQLYVLGDNRTAISPTNKFLGKDVVAYSFSKTKVVEFLKSNRDAKIIKVQMRGSALCLDNGLTVLEFALPCPPYCD